MSERDIPMHRLGQWLHRELTTHFRSPGMALVVGGLMLAIFGGVFWLSVAFPWL